MPVTAYTDTYAVGPHGEEWEADPDGDVEKKGDHGAYKDTWLFAIENFLDWTKKKK